MDRKDVEEFASLTIDRQGDLFATRKGKQKLTGHGALLHLQIEFQGRDIAIGCEPLICKETQAFTLNNKVVLISLLTWSAPLSICICFQVS